jgi:hypothetical protein
VSILTLKPGDVRRLVVRCFVDPPTGVVLRQLVPVPRMPRLAGTFVRKEVYDGPSKRFFTREETKRLISETPGVIDPSLKGGAFQS